ncbi:MAG: 4'-phosphopantetheinyl transferase superfamily protein, partial [Oscillospiraceae bacterium]
MVYIVPDCTEISAVQTDFLLKHTPIAEKNRFSERNGEKLLQGLVAHHLAVYSLFMEYGLYPHKYMIETDINGKPFIIGEKEIYLSKAHSGSFVAVAVAEKPIGVDIEKIISYRSAFAKKICSEDEIKLIDNRSDKDILLTRLFCSKEAYGKISGKGLSLCRKNNLIPISPNIFTVENFFCLTDIYDNMMLAIC